MNQGCVFCRIIAGDIPCAKVLETERVLSFLDIAPVNKGHALVVPKAHHATLWDLPLDLAAELVAAMQKVGRAIMEATGAEGLNVQMNNLEAAGQLVPHAHFHLVPRFSDDGLRLWGQHPYEQEGEIDRLAESIRKRVS
ncbi:MAG: HIT family protein [Desulfovibrionaceae bacterium]|nr:HIT family protein [Desulfovibrionaceae bacterium]MDD4953137.1 HIT family protein [Desulfovibrionaceae bacterium]